MSYCITEAGYIDFLYRNEDNGLYCVQVSVYVVWLQCV